MVRYVPIEEILILIMCFRESYQKNAQHKLEIGRSTCIFIEKIYIITTCASGNAIRGTIDP